MQILLHSDSHTDGSPEMQQAVENLLTDALGRFGDQITRVEAHLTDPNLHPNKALPDEIHCTLEARLRRYEPVVVKAHAANPLLAVQGATAKLRKAVETVVEKHEPKRGGPRPGDAAFDAAIDSAGKPAD